MTREDILRMAREAGWPGIYAKPLLSINMHEDDFLRFAALVSAHEREACAKVCDEREAVKSIGGQEMLASIRARGNK